MGGWISAVSGPPSRPTIVGNAATAAVMRIAPKFMKLTRNSSSCKGSKRGNGGLHARASDRRFTFLRIAGPCMKAALHPGGYSTVSAHLASTWMHRGCPSKGQRSSVYVSTDRWPLLPRSCVDFRSSSRRRCPAADPPCGATDRPSLPQLHPLHYRQILLNPSFST